MFKTHRSSEVKALDFLLSNLDSLLGFLDEVGLLRLNIIRRSRKHLLHEQLFDILTVKFYSFAHRLQDGLSYSQVMQSSSCLTLESEVKKRAA